MKNERINYFDIAKGIGIILVVLGHMEYIDINLRYVIVSFHMPLFFVVSGMLMNISNEETRDMKSYIKGKAKRIMLPYLSFSLLYLAVIVALIFTSSDYTWTYFFENVWLAVCLYGISVLWFLPAMFFSSILFVLMRKKLSHIITVISTLVAVIIAFYLNCGLALLNLSYSKEFYFYHLNLLLVGILRIPFALMFICIGYYFWYAFKKIRLKSVLYIIIGIVLFIPVIFMSQINQAVDLHFLVFNIWYLFLLCSVMGSLSVIFISKGLDGISNHFPIKVLRYYGKNSLIVMATHMDCYVLYTAIIICLRFIDYCTRAKSYIFCTSIILLVLLFEIPIIEIINRFFPFFVGKSRRFFDTK